MKYRALMTRDFKVIKADHDGYLYAVPLSSLSGLDDIVYLAKQGDYWNFLVIQPSMSWFDVSTKNVKRAFPGGAVRPISLEEGDICQIQFSDLTYMSISEAGLAAYHHNRPDHTHKNCGYFRLLSQGELKKLFHLVSNQWALDPLINIVKVVDYKSNFHEFYLGDHLISLSAFFALNNREELNEFIFLSERNIYRAVLFKPVIFLACFGEKAFRQLSVALSSLEDPGDYRGEILIVTDADTATVSAILPRKLYASVEVMHLKAHDFLDFVAVRQTIFSSGILEQYSPILYIDIDVMVSKPINSILCQGALINWFSAQREEWHNGVDFRCTNTAGELFYSQDPFPVDYVESGFNSGVIFIPAMSRNKFYMDLCFTSHRIYTTEQGRKTPFPEQQHLNYALRKIGAVDCDLVTALTEIGGDPNSEIIKFYGGMNVEKARGIIHYWCIDSSTRPRLMTDYLSRVREHRKTLK